MQIVGCDFHPSFQQVAILDTSTGEVRDLKLMHATGDAERFYRELESPVLIGMESMGNTLWFERLMERLGHELWIGDAAKMRASYVRKQKTDKRDAGHILQLLIEKRFPRIWVPSHLERDQRQLLLHRHRLVQMRTRVKTELQHLAMNQGLQKQRGLWSVRGRADLERLPLEGWTARRRADLLRVLEMLEGQVADLDEAVGKVAFANAYARLLMTQPGVGPITALAFVVTIGDVGRFKRGKQVASYLGLIPSERSSGQKRRLGAISKQGNVFLRTMLVEAAQSAVRYDEEFKKEYAHRCHSKPTGVAKVAAARKLAVRLYWMLRTQTPYTHAVHNEGSPSHSLVGEWGPPLSLTLALRGEPAPDRPSEWAPSHPA
jgi:transposase